MAEKFAAEQVEFKEFAGHNAPLFLDQVCPEINSEFVTSILMGKEQVPQSEDYLSIRDMSNFVLCAYGNKGNLLGFVAGSSDPINRYAQIGLVYILKGQRERGLGKILVREYIERLKTLLAIRVHVLASTTPSVLMFRDLQKEFDILEVKEVPEELLSISDSQVANE